MSASIPSWARVGARVVCVDPSDTLTEGRIYTISAVYAGADRIGQHGVKVKEAQSKWGWLGFYAVSRFRPAVEPKSEAHDLAMFRDLLRQPEPVA